MKRAIFPSTDSENQLKRKRLHDQFLEEISQLKDSSLHVVIFVLSGLKFAIEINKIDEVVPTPEISPLPKTPDYIPGIATIRGTEIIILDLAKKLSIQNENIASNNYTIVVASERFTIGILTEEIPVNMNIPGSFIQPTGHDIAGNPEDETYIKGVIKQGEDKVYLIDIDELLEGNKGDANENPKN